MSDPEPDPDEPETGPEEPGEGPLTADKVRALIDKEIA